nr:uncharacterized protein LOC109155128 [Ipomoea batatas]GMD89780.1 uncharacterized protein LOC109155128 [Ipomoea batatas]
MQIQQFSFLRNKDGSFSSFTKFSRQQDPSLWWVFPLKFLLLQLFLIGLLIVRVGIILAVLFVGFLAWAYQEIKPPPPKICGSPGGPPVTAPRIKLRDGRHLAYKEHGIPRDRAKYKIVFVHGFDCCRHDVAIAATLSPDVIESLGIYIVSIDRPGYGESDPNPNQTQKSLPYDIMELADQLAGAALIAPVSNPWWPGFPANLSNQVFYNGPPRDQWTLLVSHYTPWLTYWWNTQNLFPASSAVAYEPSLFNSQDTQLITSYLAKRKEYQGQVRQQGEFESIHRDMIVGFGKWEFDPMDLENPFPGNEGWVDLWQGDEDGLIPLPMQRYIAQKLPWVRYHELPGAGHMFPYVGDMGNQIVKALLLKD